MASFWNSGDPERDALERERLLAAAARRSIRVAALTANSRELYLGDLPQPFPAPLVNTAAGWRFDQDAGERELTARRIRRNELAALELCRRFRDAQFAYSRLATDTGGAFAARIRSRPGRHDGLFWSGDRQEDESPLGPAFAAAAFAESSPEESPRPLSGYYLKVLSVPQAPGAAIDRREIGGFALIAWPARYGVDGVLSFQMNQSGAIYQKDLGPDTSRLAASAGAYHPDNSWSRVLTH